MSANNGGTSRLTYGLATVPAPLATDRPVHIDIVVSNSGTEAVLCKQILVEIPTGDLAQDLVPAGHRIVPTVEPADQWTVDEIESGVLLTLPQDEMAAFTPGNTPLTIRPASGESVSLAAHGLLLRLKDFKANKLAGTALLRIRETVSTDNGQTWETNQLVLPLAKYPPAEALTADVVGDLVLRETDANGNPGSTPVTLLKPGQKAVLTWTAPADATCDVYYDGRHKHLSSQDKWQLPVSGLTRDTHFHVQVTLQRSGDTITHHLSTAVAVEEPVLPRLTVETIKANGAKNGDGHQFLTIQGAMQVKEECHVFGTLYGGGGTLTVGDAVVAKKNVSAEAEVTVTGSLTAQKVQAQDEAQAKKFIVDAVQAKELTVDEVQAKELVVDGVQTKTLAVTEKALVGSTNFSGMDNGDLWISGKFSADRAHLNTLLGTPEKLTEAFDGRERQAPSHGLLLLWARTTGSHATRTIYVSIDNGSGWEVVGAATIDYGNAPDLKGSSATIPLRKGQKYMIWQEGSGGGTTDAYFFPVLSG
ncbi:hypothetical protein CTZ27_31925 [Streptomyces griseocarneus]|nr:hypothetical protein CTZ27_31925 [Streptomyces griseocarneus]